jgi:ribosomal protein L11 methyltransferase
MMVEKELAPSTGASKLPRLIGRALFDPDLKHLLLEQPHLVAERFGLDEDDQQRLMRANWSDLEYAVGCMVRSKFMPVQVGRRVWISPLPKNGQEHPDRIDIFIDQSSTGAKIGYDGLSNRKGVVFGSGTHPTTRLCVLLLERHLQPGLRVLDLGTGSGILSIVAVRLGAGAVVGLDVDEAAVAAARANTHRNELDGNVQMHIGKADWLQSSEEPTFDLIVANILADIHLQSIKDGLLDYLSSGGRVILSGMHHNGAVRVAQALYQAGVDEVEYLRMGTWYALNAQLGEGR